MLNFYFLKILLICFILITISCSQNKKNNISEQSQSVYCKKGLVTEIVGKNNYFGFNSDIIIICSFEYNNSSYEGKLITDFSRFNDYYSPFSVNDSVIIKFLDKSFNDKKKIITEIYLLNKYIHNNEKWEAFYSKDDICNPKKPLDYYQDKSNYSRGKIKE